MNAPKPAPKKQKTTVKSSPSSAPPTITAAIVGDGQPSQSAQERPVGKKKEKQILRQRAVMESMEYLVAKKKEADAEKDLREVQKGFRATGRLDKN
jgi:hypothetical protein